MFKRYGPHLVPIRCGTSFWHMVGGKISVIPHLYLLKMLKISWEIQICMGNMYGKGKHFLTPDLPHTAPNLDCWDQTPRRINSPPPPQNPTYVFPLR